MSRRWFTCTASSEHNHDHLCSNVYDSDTETTWATLGEGSGAWIEIQFPFDVTVTQIETRHRGGGGWDAGENFKDIALLFSDGTTQYASIQGGTNPEWNVVTMSPTVRTHFIRITAISLHGPTVNPGFSEIEFYGCPDMVKMGEEAEL